MAGLSCEDIDKSEQPTDRTRRPPGRSASPAARRSATTSTCRPPRRGSRRPARSRRTPRRGASRSPPPTPGTPPPWRRRVPSRSLWLRARRRSASLLPPVALPAAPQLSPLPGGIGQRGGVLARPVLGAGACGLSGDTVSYTGAGNCVIDANQAANADYSAAPQVTQTILVRSATTTAAVTVSPAVPPVGQTVSYTATVTDRSGRRRTVSVAFTKGRRLYEPAWGRWAPTTTSATSPARSRSTRPPRARRHYHDHLRHDHLRHEHLRHDHGGTTTAGTSTAGTGTAGTGTAGTTTAGTGTAGTGTPGTTTTTGTAKPPQPTAANKPTLTSLSPAAGPMAGGTTVVIRGKWFDDVERVRFGTRTRPVQGRLRRGGHRTFAGWRRDGGCLGEDGGRDLGL